MEQLYPFPMTRLKEELNKYPDAELMWTQEEPRNMGAWFYIWNLMGTMIKQKVSRKSSASPATDLQRFMLRSKRILWSRVLSCE